MTDDRRPSSDNPITSAAQDRLDRARVARDFAASVRRSNASQGLVVGVLGPWGSGKSSFVNLMREEFAREPALTVVDFNPWMFSGSQQLVDFFFSEVASELRLRDKTRFGMIAEGLDDYGDVLSPLALVPGFGAWFDRSFKALRSASSWYRRRREGASPIREKVSKALAALDDPVVIVIDDIDRLSTDEIRDIFKLVRLTASFPNLIYIVAFDRERVERALDESNVPGRAYLEKIIQLPFDLPSPGEGVLRSEVFDRLNEVLGDVEGLRFDTDRWPDIFFEVIDPLLMNLRDVTRYAAAVRPTLEALGSEIETSDLLALEAIRVFRPELHAAIRPLAAVLTGPGGYSSRDEPESKAAVERLFDLAGDDQTVMRALLTRLFPASRRHFDNFAVGYESQKEWRRQHQVAHPDFLELYFSRQSSTGLLAYRWSERAFSEITDRERFAAVLDSVPAKELEETFQALETFEGAYPEEAVVPGSIELLNRVTSIPDRPSRGMFDIVRPDMVVIRVVLRLL